MKILARDIANFLYFSERSWGQIRKQSPYSVSKTLDRLEKAVRANNLTIFLRVNHAANAATIGIKLRPTELLIFGNPRIGAPLMKVQQATGIDLPMKALAIEDEQGQVYLSYNALSYMVWRHKLGNAAAKVIEKASASLDKLTDAAVKIDTA